MEWEEGKVVVVALVGAPGGWLVSAFSPCNFSLLWPWARGPAARCRQLALLRARLLGCGWARL